MAASGWCSRIAIPACRTGFRPRAVAGGWSSAAGSRPTSCRRSPPRRWWLWTACGGAPDSARAARGRAPRAGGGGPSGRAPRAGGQGPPVPHGTGPPRSSVDGLARKGEARLVGRVAPTLGCLVQSGGGERIAVRTVLLARVGGEEVPHARLGRRRQRQAEVRVDPPHGGDLVAHQ